MSTLGRAIGALLAVALTACGGASVTTPDTTVSTIDVPPPVDTPAQGRPLLGEAWPDPVAGHIDRLYDGRRTAEDFVLGASTSLPATLVFRVVDGPIEIAAVSLGTVDDPRSVRDVTVSTYLGDVPVDRDTFHRFFQNATPAGVARLEATDGETVLRFAQPVLTHYVFVQIDATHGSGGVVLTEVSAFEADELLDLAESRADVTWLDLSSEALEPVEPDDIAIDDDDAPTTDVVDVFESVEEGTGEDAP